MVAVELRFTYEIVKVKSEEVLYAGTVSGYSERGRDGVRFENPYEEAFREAEGHAIESFMDVFRKRNVFYSFEWKALKDKEKKKAWERVTLEEALKAKKYGKIYFQIGINEMGRGTLDGFMTAYEDSVEKFRELQPDAVIFVQGIMKVAKEKSDKDPIFNNVGIEQRNERIAALADGKNIFYLDMNEVVCDEEGNLKSSLTFDDIHLYGSKYGIWVDYLKENGI
jgi:hypothetical protein